MSKKINYECKGDLEVHDGVYAYFIQDTFAFNKASMFTYFIQDIFAFNEASMFKITKKSKPLTKCHG